MACVTWKGMNAVLLMGRHHHPFMVQVPRITSIVVGILIWGPLTFLFMDILGGINFIQINPIVPLEDAGYGFSGSGSGFTVPITTNCIGLLIRRRMDQGAGIQMAQVFVDGVYAGTWYDPDGSFSLVNNRWVDSEFMVASNLVTGKSEVRISIVPSSVAKPWNEFCYWVYGISPFSCEADVDHDGLLDEWEFRYVAVLDGLQGNRDSDADGFSDFDEYRAGTSPVSAESFPRIMCSPNGRDVSFDSEIGHFYTIEQSFDLVSNEWDVVRENIPGTGSQIGLPMESDSPRSFYRLQIKEQ